VADDLVQRLRACVRLKESHAWDELIEAADALARKDAEIAGWKAEVEELVRALNLCTQRAVQAEARAANVEESLHYANGVADLAMKHRDEAEARVMEAPVGDVRPFMACAKVEVNGLPVEWGGKRVALVLLETEEEK
jgi:hypothetical protein